MSDESGGFEWTLVEIAEMGVAVLIFLVIGTVIFVAPQTDFIQVKATSVELAYITNLITNTDINVKTKYPDLQLFLTKNELKVQSSKEEKLVSSQKVYGTEHDIRKLDEDLYCISSYKTCDDSSATLTSPEDDSITATKTDYTKENQDDKINYNGP